MPRYTLRVSLRRPLVSLACVIAIAMLGCTPVPTVEQTPADAFVNRDVDDVSWPRFARVEIAGIEGLGTASYIDDDVRAHAIVPQLQGHPTFNAHLGQWADQVMGDFATQVGDRAGSDEAWLTTMWEATAISEDIVGIVLSAEISLGGVTTHIDRVLWYSPNHEEILNWRELLTDSARAELPEEMAARLATSVPQAGRGEVDAAEIASLLEVGDTAVGFSEKGNLVVIIDGGRTLSRAFGAPAVEFTGAQTANWLTPMGVLAQTATVSPVVEAVPVARSEREGEIAAAPATPAAPVEPAKVEEPKEIDCGVDRCVALTFDDGPAGTSTTELLKILEKEGVPATFFMIGIQVRAFPEIVAKVHEAGHEIGNHTWSHPSLPQLSVKDIRKQLQRTTQALEEITGESVKLMRPPYGATSGKVAEAAKAEGLSQIMWSTDTEDWARRNVKTTTSRAVEVKGGGIILMHDIYPETVEAVPKILKKLRAEGFEFVTVSTLLGETKPGKTYRARPKQ